MSSLPEPGAINLKRWTDFATLRARLRSEGLGVPDLCAQLWSSICGGAFSPADLWSEKEALAIEYHSLSDFPRPIDLNALHPQTLSKRVYRAKHDLYLAKADWETFGEPVFGQKMRELNLLPPGITFPISKKSDCRTYGLEIGKDYGFHRSKIEPKEKWYEKAADNTSIVGGFCFDVGTGGIQAGPPTSFRISFGLRLHKENRWAYSLKMEHFFSDLDQYNHVRLPSSLPFPQGYIRPNDEVISDMVKLGIFAHLRAFDIFLSELGSMPTSELQV